MTVSELIAAAKERALTLDDLDNLRELVKQAEEAYRRDEQRKSVSSEDLARTYNL